MPDVIGEQSSFHRHTLDDEREAWIRACLAALCAAYDRSAVKYGYPSEARCEHHWCLGVVDVLTRALGQ